LSGDGPKGTVVEVDVGSERGTAHIGDIYIPPKELISLVAVWIEKYGAVYDLPIRSGVLIGNGHFDPESV
jgi:hypothetical protein